ncbi:MAG: MBOAT family protein [Planctomycetota bacterium]|nr:MBOAT family protein [Planctomycetota bacterium]
MNFASPEFLVFFALVAGIYWLLSHRQQNWLLLAASYIFYGWWDWRFLSLLLVSSAVDFSCGLLLDRGQSPRIRKRVLAASIATNIGLLGTFKYFDFFSHSLQRCLSALGLDVSLPMLNIILPVGISFYTFQTLSYTIDVYRKKLAATDHLFDFMLYVSFFPQLVAGPIERARHLLPQILGQRQFSVQMATSGLQLAIVGFFKKLVIADNLAILVNIVYSDAQADGLTVLLATYAFAFQIYCDFSGYTDIARGISRILGFDICENFRLPYFATSPSDFWQRWHISLSAWLRDYLYIPLGGNRGGQFATLRNLALTMLLGGLWHGASLHFVAWGAYQGILLIGFRLVSLDSSGREEPVRRRGAMFWLKVFGYFQLTCYGWLIFRAADMSRVVDLTYSLASLRQWSWNAIDFTISYELMVLVAPLICVQVYQFHRDDMEPWTKWSTLPQTLFYLGLFYATILFGATEQNEFIYFQF